MWLETITIRLPATNRDWLLEELRKTQMAMGLKNKYSFVMFARQPNGLDISIHLHHDDSQLAIPSLIGLQLAQALGAFGSVDHGFWEIISTKSHPTL